MKNSLQEFNSSFEQEELKIDELVDQVRLPSLGKIFTIFYNFYKFINCYNLKNYHFIMIKGLLFLFSY